MQEIDGEKKIDLFMEENSSLLNKLSCKVYGENLEISKLAFKSIARSALTAAFGAFSRKENQEGNLNAYLHGTLNLAAKKITHLNKSKLFICPACKIKGNVEPLRRTYKAMSCSACISEGEKAKTIEEKFFYSSFAHHKMMGYRCPKCVRFIPTQSSSKILCPYVGCGFEGDTTHLTKMGHPFIRVSDTSIVSSSEEKIDTSSMGREENLVFKEKIEKGYEIILSTIEEQMKTLHYKGSSSTYIIKTCMYKAFASCLNECPEDMIPYFAYYGRGGYGGKMQFKIFQKFISFLEKEIPYNYITSKGEKLTVNSLIDEKLSIFAGQTSFISEINENGEIPNLTKEIYVGGRSAFYNEPFHLGKIVDICLVDDGRSLLNSMQHYGPGKIKMQDNIVPNGTKVEVKHLMICPHPQMGAFVYLNRLKKIVCERTQAKFNAYDQQ
jgi:hypothetical protein